MANIIKKPDAPAAEWNPFRVMREMMNWDPFQAMTPFTNFSNLEPSWNPSFEVTENKDSFLFKADVPGVKKEDIEITHTGNRLQISGKRESEQETKNDTVYTYERQYGSFTRSFTLPDGVDLEHAKTDLQAGVLTLVVPKLAAAQSKKIPITSGTKS